METNDTEAPSALRRAAVTVFPVKYRGIPAAGDAINSCTDTGQVRRLAPLNEEIGHPLVFKREERMRDFKLAPKASCSSVVMTSGSAGDAPVVSLFDVTGLAALLGESSR
ncbi:unnamed protein product [Boreogadus saida]